MAKFTLGDKFFVKSKIKRHLIFGENLDPHTVEQMIVDKSGTSYRDERGTGYEENEIVAVGKHAMAYSITFLSSLIAKVHNEMCSCGGDNGDTE